MSDHDVAPAGSSLAALHALTAAAHARLCPGSPPPVITGPPPQPAVPPMAASPATGPHAAGSAPGHVPLSEENKLFLARLRTPYLSAAATAVAAVGGPPPTAAAPAPAQAQTESHGAAAAPVSATPEPGAPAALAPAPSTATTTTTHATTHATTNPTNATTTPMTTLRPTRPAGSAIHPAILRRYGSAPQPASARLRHGGAGPAARPHRTDSANRPGRYDDSPPQPAVPDLSTCLLTAARLADLVIPRRRALLDRWLCQGDLGYIFAPRGVGKTWMAMALPRALSLGQPLGLWQAGNAAQESSSASASSTRPPGSPPSSMAAAAPTRAAAAGSHPPPPAQASRPAQPISILYIDGEMPLELTQQRSRKLDLGQAAITYLHHESLYAAHGTSLNLALEPHREAVMNLVVQQGFQCVILDNLSSLTSGIDENAGIDFDPLSQWLLEFRRRQITVIIVHHAGRNGLMRGHSKREDACSWILELRDAKTDADSGAKFTTHFAKPSRNTGHPLPDLLWHFTTGEDGKISVGCEYATSADFQQFIDLVKSGMQRQVEIAEAMNKPKGTISKWAARALEEGLLSGTQRRLLPPADSASSAPAKPRARRDDDNASFFDDAALEAELQAANAEALRHHLRD